MINQNDFTVNLYYLLEETFETYHGIYLDKGTSLLDTLKVVSAQEASIPVGGKCATLAAQVTHVVFYLDVLERYIVDHDTSPADWGAVWRTVSAVTDDEWDALKTNLEATYRRVDNMLRGIESWTEDSVGGALGIVVHTAYHLGEIRQALCTLKR
jgi:hypothetical protein